MNRRHNVQHLDNGDGTGSSPNIYPNLILFIVLGLVSVWHIDRSYWSDEAWVVDFARQPGVTDGWAQSIAHGLPGAPGYLAVLHFLSPVAKLWQDVYRVPSAVAGGVLLWTVARILGNQVRSRAIGAAGAIAILACPFVQRYLTETKSYMLAAMFTVGLISAADWWTKTRQWPAALTWLGLALGSLTLTFGGWFAIAGTGVVLFVQYLIRSDRTQVVRVAVLGAIVTTMAAVIYLSYIRAIASSQMNQDFWGSYYLPTDWTLPVALWRELDRLLREAWWLYAVPARVMLMIWAVGMVAWCWRQPTAGFAAVVVMGLILAANLAGRWPLALRINLPLVVLLHLGMCQALLAPAAWLLKRTTSATAQKTAAAPPRLANVPVGLPSAVGWTTLCLASALALLVSWSADYEVASIDRLLDQTNRASSADDLVVFDWAAGVNHQLSSAPISASVRRVTWPMPDTVVDDFRPFVRDLGPRRLLFIAAGHHNHERETVWALLGKALSANGHFEQIWTDRLVALYRYRPHWPQSGDDG